MLDYFTELLAFFNSLTLYSFAKLFWPFVFFEFPRYVMMDGIGIGFYWLRRNLLRRERWAAKARFFEERPLISILAPGKNEGKNLYKLVTSLNEQTYDNLEIIVVDDGSNDESGIIGRNLERLGKVHKFLRNEQRGGKASAANLAYRYATGDFIVHVDCDSSFDRDAIERIIIPFYMDPKCGGVGGNVKVRNTEDSLASTVQGIEYLKNISVGRTVTSTFGIYRIISGAFGAFRRDILDQIGAWDIGPGLDGDITVKIRKLGYRIYFEPKAVCLTATPTKFFNLARQRVRWSRSLIRFRLRKHLNVFYPQANFSLLNVVSFTENITFNLILNIKWFFYVAFLAFGFPSLLKFIIPINIMLYICANLLEFGFAMLLSERRKQEIKLLPYVPLMVPYIGLFLRLVRSLAYVQEFFFKSSYNDAWNPKKTSDKALERGL